MDDKEYIKPSVEWMSENYSKLNSELFGGKLGSCEFGIFTSGSGSRGNCLGRFMLLNRSVRISLSSRRMFVKTYSGKEYIDKANFVQLCRPCIMLNGHYSATEDALLSTLVHEMVHYADYMYGICPKQGHGPSFREIAMIVSSRSNGRFSVQRVASAEEMKEYKLDDEIKARNERIAQNKKNNTVFIFVYRNDGKIEMTPILKSNRTVVDEICDYYERHNGEANEIIASSDPGLVDMLYSYGYKKVLRTWRLYNVTDKPWISRIKDYKYTVLYNALNESKEVNNP